MFGSTEKTPLKSSTVRFCALILDLTTQYLNISPSEMLLWTLRKALSRSGCLQLVRGLALSSLLCLCASEYLMLQDDKAKQALSDLSSSLG